LLFRALPHKREEEEEEEWRKRRKRRRRKVLFKADAVNEEDSERDRATQV